MELFAINWWAILLCVPISMAVGMVWYHPKTFFGIWWKSVGKPDSRPGGNMGLTWSLTVLASLAKGLGLALAIRLVELGLGRMDLVFALATALGLWALVIAPSYLVNKRFAGHGLHIWAIETGNHLADLLLFALLFGLWR